MFVTTVFSTAPPSNVRSDLTVLEDDVVELEVRWSPPPPEDANGQLTGYQVNNTLQHYFRPLYSTL